MSKKKVNTAGSYVYELMKSGVGVSRTTRIILVVKNLNLVFKNNLNKKTVSKEERK
tara:strand:- start:283 stop:450 length:168 start_codon:yes stop_codon:yes gene_type:complete